MRANIVDTADWPCWGGSIDVAFSVWPGDWVWSGTTLSNPDTNPGLKRFRVVEAQVTYTADSSIEAHTAKSKWVLTGDASFVRKSWNNNGAWTIWESSQ